ncbi:hypothetical protein O3W52_00025 [Ensifer psoraleae]|uniref:Uncharacterized protein n=1 Tax=Sinorhizobium psoraleae TaxID=520838 RepID=A0ABT4K9D6_9HYPH|nr:hypothetical protein [Sinorhizobium psoraleae]
MTTKPDQKSAHAEPHQPQDRFATLSFERKLPFRYRLSGRSGCHPAARAVWASPSPSVTVEFLEADSRLGGREVSLCKVARQPDIRCECGWLELQPTRRSVNYEVVSSGGVTQSAALVTADFQAAEERSRLTVTVQLSSLAEDMRDGYQQGFSAGLNNPAQRGRANHGAGANDKGAAKTLSGKPG